MVFDVAMTLESNVFARGAVFVVFLQSLKPCFYVKIFVRVAICSLDDKWDMIGRLGYMFGAVNTFFRIGVHRIDIRDINTENRPPSL